tara:strand:+ start:3123 stop:3677 length:555 start_codon:yes stop_codon:yes gene_type:complete
MPCALTTGFNLDCKDSISGIRSIRFATKSDYDALTATVASGEVTAIGVASTVFYKYELRRETSSFNDDPQADQATGSLFYRPSISMMMNRLDTAKRNEVQLLAKNRLVAIIETQQPDDASGDGDFWVLGHESGLDMVPSVGTSGTSPGDRNGYELSFEGMEPDPCMKINPATGTVDTLLGTITA